MTYDEFEAVLQGRGISIEYKDPRDQVTRLDTPLPVKVDPATTPDPYPLEFDVVYFAQWFYPPDGACPSTLLLGDLRAQKWYPMGHFMPV